MEPNEQSAPETPDEHLPNALAGNDDAAPEPEAEDVNIPSTINYQPPTTPEMEVHHHAHHEHGKKHWKTYFFDFFMLFLAVLCGFLAEYQLEHKIERDRAKQFLQSMLIDVRTNIVNLDSLMQENRQIITHHDA